MWCYIVVRRGTANTFEGKVQEKKTVALPTLCGIVPWRAKSLVDFVGLAIQSQDCDTKTLVLSLLALALSV